MSDDEIITVAMTDGGTVKVRVRSMLTFYATDCEGCMDEPPSDESDDAEEAAATGAYVGLVYLEDGPRGPGNYCEKCRHKMAEKEGGA